MNGLITKIAIIIIAALTALSVYQYKVNKTLTKENSAKTTEIKSLMYGTASFKNEANKWQSISIEQNKSIANLKHDKDSLNLVFKKVLKDSKIKEKDVTQIGSIETQLDADTTITYNVAARDTVYDISSLPYIKELITIKNDSLTRELQISNSQKLIWHTKRETIDPPKSFFLFRWFQKKHDVTYVDIINDNPFIKTTNQTFQIITK